MPRNPKELNADELKKVLALRHTDITLTKLRQLFADTETTSSHYNPQDKLTLPKDAAFNKTTIRTNLGRLIANMFILAPLKGKVEYRNVAFDQKTINALIADATTQMTEGNIIAEDYIDFMERLGWLGYVTSIFMTPGFCLDGVRIPPKTAILKAKLLAEHRKGIESGDPATISLVEKALLGSAKAELKVNGSTALDYYESGARGNFDNNYKNMALIRGLVTDPQNPGKFLVGKSNLTDGTPPEEQHVSSNILIQGAGGRALDTKKSGYMSKQLTSAFQGLVLAPDGSDCKTKRTLKVRISSDNAKNFALRYAVVNGALVLLDSQTIKKFYDKDVQLRSPMFCKTPAVCEKCYGRLPYELGITNVGLTYNAIGERLKGLSMKQFHDSTVHLGEVDLDRAITADI